MKLDTSVFKLVTIAVYTIYWQPQELKEENHILSYFAPFWERVFEWNDEMMLNYELKDFYFSVLKKIRQCDTWDQVKKKINQSYGDSFYPSYQKQLKAFNF